METTKRIYINTYIREDGLVISKGTSEDMDEKIKSYEDTLNILEDLKE